MRSGFVTFSMGYENAGDGGLPAGAEANAHRDRSGIGILIRVVN
jgi:hypothetical protein